MKKLFLVGVAISGLTIAGLTGDRASAADLRPFLKAPPAPPPIVNWTGFYLGVNAGGSIGLDSTTQVTTFTSPALGPNGLLSSTSRSALPGAVLGGQIGMNWQVSPVWVLGLEADWQWTSEKGSMSNCTPPASLAFFGPGASAFGYCLATEQKLSNIGTARARAGAVVNDTLWYVTGGAAWGTVKDSYQFTGSANPLIFPGLLQPGPFLPSGGSFSSTKVGWTVGAGVEQRLGPGWSVKLEYLYVDLGSITDTFGININAIFGPAFTQGVASVSSSSHVTDNIVRLGINYKFGWIPGGY